MELLEMVGNTPLFELKKLCTGNGVRIFVKAEYQNPSGSVKDRAEKGNVD